MAARQAAPGQPSASCYGPSMRSMCRGARSLGSSLVLALGLGLLLSGCPRQPTAPDPGMGTPCESMDECNEGEACGLLRLCVDNFCEAEPTLVRPCPGTGTPVQE